MSNGIIATTTLEIDWCELGEHLADQHAAEVSDFLCSFAEMMHRHPDADAPLDCIAEILNRWASVPDAGVGVEHLRWMLAGLLERLS